MRLTSWNGAPSSKIHKYDIVIANEMAKLHAETEFEKYRVIQDENYISDFDELLTEAKN